MNYFYTGAQGYVFPDLRGISYTHIVGSVGFNLHTNNSKWRFFTGAHGGALFRNGARAIAGIEGGVDFKIKDNLYIGVGGTYDIRTDGKVWGMNEQNYWRENGHGRIGYLW